MEEIKEPPFDNNKNLSKEIKNTELKNVSEKTSNLSRKLRITEERYNNVKKKSEFNESNLLETHQTITKEIKLLTEEINNSKKEINEMKSQVNNLIGEISNFVKYNDFNTLKKYVEYWEPMNFITHNQLMNIINKKSN